MRAFTGIIKGKDVALTWKLYHLKLEIHKKPETQQLLI